MTLAMRARAVARQEIPGRQRPAPATTCTDPQLLMALGNWTWTYSAQDAYALDGALGAVPFMTIGNAMNDADLDRLYRSYVLGDHHL